MTLVEKDRWYNEELRAETVIYTIEVDGERVGLMNFVVPDEDFSDNAYLENIDIDEAHRNKGHGTEALKEAAKMYWRVYIAPTNEDNARLYARLGEDARGQIREEEMEVNQGHGVYVLNR